MSKKSVENLATRVWPYWFFLNSMLRSRNNVMVKQNGGINEYEKERMKIMCYKGHNYFYILIQKFLERKK